MRLIHRLRYIYHEYPRQYWLMILGIVLATAGSSMIWPFLLIYASGKLELPLSTVATLISINAGTGIFASLIAGTLADKVGRKVVMNFSLTVNGIAYFLLMRAETYPQFVGLMIMVGLSNPLYQVGADAMLADMVSSEKRTDAYAINRIAHNAAFAMGPAIGGFLATRSYDLAFICAGIGFLSYSGLLFFLARETLVKSSAQSSIPQAPAEGYSRVLRDKNYMVFVAMISLGLIAPTMLWILMPVYTKTNFGIPEAMYGWIPTTNAILCVFVQYWVTNITRHHRTLPVLSAAMVIYALGVGSVALMNHFWGFWLSMVILTFGELTLVPTASTFVADIAPPYLRGRYMSMHWLGWGMARTLAPIIGGFLNDNIAPRAIWIGGLLIGLTSALGIFLLHRVSAPRTSTLIES
ncbi:MAG TPA: MFS transporter [Anaerolineales bacterium]|jgi:MFS family permease|nr:MFS transporter [Anaerolineales bacterium]